MWMHVNPNPKHKNVPDCVIRAICFALNMNWYDVYDDLCEIGRRDCNMPSSDSVWGHYLQIRGCRPFLLPKSCPQCTTIKDFTRIYPKGSYIIGTGSHAVAVIDGDYYDSWDSGDEVPSFFWKVPD